MLNNKTILVTGGTGSFGKSFAKHLLENFDLKKLIIFSRDELKQFKMERELNDERLRFFIGDVRDLPRLQRAFNNVDIVIHAAALKQVPTLEYNPFEAVKTNIIGSQNIIEAAIDQKVAKVILISTDKAVQPINLYGSTKLCAEKLFISGNSYAPGKTKFSCVRYGNVIGSRGSIIETLMKNRDAEKVFITDEKMTRFWLELEKSFDLVLFALANMVGGEIIIPKVPSMKLVDLFKIIVPNAKREVIGIRPGEKLHEVLITEEEAKHTLELNKYFVVIPEFSFSHEQDYNKYKKRGKNLKPNFRFCSNKNREQLTKSKFIELIKKL